MRKVEGFLVYIGVFGFGNNISVIKIVFFGVVCVFVFIVSGR